MIVRGDEPDDRSNSLRISHRQEQQAAVFLANFEWIAWFGAHPVICVARRGWSPWTML
jgi:hypothetical protein